MVHFGREAVTVPLHGSGADALRALRALPRSGWQQPLRPGLVARVSPAGVRLWYHRGLPLLRFGLRQELVAEVVGEAGRTVLHGRFRQRASVATVVVAWLILVAILALLIDRGTAPLHIEHRSDLMASWVLVSLAAVGGVAALRWVARHERRILLAALDQYLSAGAGGASAPVGT